MRRVTLKRRVHRRLVVGPLRQSRGRKRIPVLECWTTLTAAAAHTSRLKVGSFMTNVMNRHPAVLARMLATLWDQSGGRVELGIGVGGSGPGAAVVRHRAAGARRALADPRGSRGGHPAALDGRTGRLRRRVLPPAARRRPTPRPNLRRASSSAARSQPVPGWRRAPATAGRPMPTTTRRCCPFTSRHCPRHGRSRAQIAHLVAVSIEKEVPLDRQPLFADMATFLGKWQDRGADEVIVSWVKPADLPALLEAGAKTGLAS